MTDNAKIIDTAALMLKAAQNSNIDDYYAVIGDELKNVSNADFPLVWFAYKMLGGKIYSINTDNNDNVQRYYDLANELGAIVLEPQEATNSCAGVLPGLVSVTFVPANIKAPKETRIGQMLLPPCHDSAD